MLKKRLHYHYFYQKTSKTTLNSKQTLRNNQKKRLCTQTSYTNQRETCKTKGRLVEPIIPKPPTQQQPTSKKAAYFYNNNQTNQKPQTKPETNLKKQPEKRRVHTGQTNNNQKEKD